MKLSIGIIVYNNLSAKYLNYFWPSLLISLNISLIFSLGASSGGAGGPNCFFLYSIVNFFRGIIGFSPSHLTFLLRVMLSLNPSQGPKPT